MIFPSVERSKSEVNIPINQGRWWIANEDLQYNQIEQQIIDLEQNGMTRRLFVTLQIFQDATKISTIGLENKMVKIILINC